MVTCLFIAVYIVAFFYMTYRSQQFNWLWGSVVLWLGFGVLGARILPSVWGITHSISLLHPYFYISLASVFFFINHWKFQRLPHILICRDENEQTVSQTVGRSSMFVSDPQVGSLPAFWAVSGLILHLAYLLMLLISIWFYPNGNSFFTVLSLLQMYFLNPIFWIGAQGVLIGLMWITRTIRSKKFVMISYEDLLVVFFCSILLCVIYVVYDASQFIALWRL